MNDFYYFDHLSHENGLIHAITKKEIGEAYAFSLALHTGENREKIVANRTKLAQKLMLSKSSVFVVANQTHNDHIVVIDERVMRGWESVEDAVEDCDAMITNQQQVILAILTADCVPLLLFDPVERVVAAVHAGWRGTEAKIAKKTIAAMQSRFGSNPSHILAAVAPAIRGCCYEVGEDVARHFRAYPDALEQRGEKYMLDLPMINRQQLIASGMMEKNIEMSDLCTACKVDHFFSYRREHGCSGRFMSMIGMHEGVVQRV
ncbi:MAG: peptidoglycan editing factor PgeF [Campylobacterota bacterium]|nr:peptidoglycan editing factor PgeF [Campylobacterota bacterium]